MQETILWSKEAPVGRKILITDIFWLISGYFLQNSIVPYII